jgi:multiple sugar transport system substrate-binding protein
MNIRRFTIGSCLLLSVTGLFLASGCSRPQNDKTVDGRTIVTYWEKWTGFEGDAMQAVVDDFNKSQDRIFVERLPVSSIDRKIMLATAGGDPPDVAGLWSWAIPNYAEKGALTPLNKYLAEAGISRTNYIPVFWDLCSYRGFTWALPSTPATIALHWNKKMFREAGLDPDVPPKSLDELDAMVEKLTIVEIERKGKRVRVRYPELTPEEKEAKNFSIVQLGTSPAEPGWYNQMWGYWFGGRLLDGERKIAANSPENVAALAWFSSYPNKYGLRNMQAFGATFGNFASPQNAFLAGRIAMVIQGVWMYNFISKYSPGMEWAAAPFPAKDPEKTPNVTIAECDVLVIPHGARNAKEAFEFIQYVNSEAPMEKLCLAQRKFSPLAAQSKDFVEKHPNPNIQVFIDLAKSPNALYVPQISIWNEYVEEMNVAYDRASTGKATPQGALDIAEKRVQWKYDRIMRRWDKVKDERIKEWSQ